jgi:hypothetical protein
VAWAAGILLITWSAAQNFDLVFNQYQRNYELSAWNTSEIGQVIRDFSGSLGNSESAFVLAYPYWVDTPSDQCRFSDEGLRTLARPVPGYCSKSGSKLFIIYRKIPPAWMP